MFKRNLPLMVTIMVFVLGYLLCLASFPAFMSTRIICNILTDNAFLGIVAVGMTFVILSGGIDLSVGAVIAFMVWLWLTFTVLLFGAELNAEVEVRTRGLPAEPAGAHG